MADPLTQTVEEFAPAPLNLFDQKQAETIISRHSNSRRNLESAAKTFEAEQAASRVEQERIKAQRDALLATREDEIYAQKKEADSLRSKFIGDMFDALRPKEEGYDQRMVEFFKGVPESVQKDEVFREVLKGYTSMAEKAEAERRQQREIEARGEQQRTTLQERTKLSSLYSNLKPEDWEKAPRDEAGEPSMEWLASKAADRKIERELELAKGKKDIQVEAQKDLFDYKNMDAGQKARHDETEKIIINDTDAFPRRVDMVMSKYGEFTEDYTPDQARELREARAWDKNLFKNEVLAAKASENMEDYVNAPGMENLPPLQKEYRRRVWEYANTFGGKLPPSQGETEGQGGGEETAPAPASAAAAAAPAAPAAPAPASAAAAPAPAPAAAAPAPAPAAPAPAPAAPAPAAPAPTITREQILQRVPQGSEVYTGSDGFFRVRLPDGSVKRVVPK